ncbi:4236_t:CDS:2 [Rhizophagus irregularis]|nr:4236_t:CDS:2 [Rhizophagus irregularis]
MGNIKRIFALIITLFVISAFSRSTFSEQLKHKRQNKDNGLFTPYIPLEPTPNPITRSYEVELSQINLAPDGFTKTIFAINGQYPGTVIHANKGDRIQVTVKNNIGEPSVIHWHGMFQRGTNCTQEQRGTFWYHAHTHGQYMEGIRAPLIIHDPNDPYRKDYDFEYIITMSDWYHQRVSDMLAIRMSPNYGGRNPIPDSGLISGAGRYNCSAAPPGSECRENNPLAEYKVTPGKKYRLRLINTSGLSHFMFSIDNHPLKIIEADGEYSKPVIVNKLPVAIGQRYSVIIDANQKVDNYWMRATIDDRCLLINNQTVNFDSAINYNVTGILKYDGAGLGYPTSTEYPDQLEPCLSIDPNLLKTLEPQQIPGPATNKIQLVVTFRDDDQNVTRAFINNSSFVVDDNNPTLEKFVSDDVPLDQFPANQNIYAYDQLGGTIDIAYIRSGIVVDESKLNLVDPFPRDTFVVNSTSWSVFRYKADNPGVWSIHCHIEWHVEMGMIAQLIELPTELSKVTIPESVSNLCKQQDNSNSKRSKFSRRNRLFNTDMKRIKV